MMKLHALGILAFSLAAAAQAGIAGSARAGIPHWPATRLWSGWPSSRGRRSKVAHDAEMVLVGDRAYVVAEVQSTGGPGKVRAGRKSTRPCPS